jgi:uncharacterized protein (DUF1800 family)
MVWTHSARAKVTPTSRQIVQHLLRRFAFSATPAQVNMIMQQGVDNWINNQLFNWSSISDANTELDAMPLATGDDDPFLPNRLQYQHIELTNRQIQAKLELHWLELFSVNGRIVSRNLNPMIPYDQTIRANALGNFQTLLTAVGEDPEMLRFLDNDGNAAAASNLNFAREIMQVFSIGIYQLNDDGTLALGPNGQPVANYSPADITAIAKAMSGYKLDVVDDFPNFWPERFIPANCSGANTVFLGATYNIPCDGTGIAVVAGILANNRNAAPFQVKQLLQRFVTENPPPQYVADIVPVWRQYANSPNQIAYVVQAIIYDPLFKAYYHAMPKQPLEAVLDAIRVIPTTQYGGGQYLNYDMAKLGQGINEEPNVFSFYPPGHIENLITSDYIYAMQSVVTGLINLRGGNSIGLGFSIPALRNTIGSSNGGVIGAYLLDALVDGGSPTLQSDVRQILGSLPNDAQIQQALWLILNSSEYAVN